MSYEIYGSFNVLDAETKEFNEQAEELLAVFAESHEDVNDIITENMASGSSCGDRIDTAIKQFTSENPTILIEFQCSDSEDNRWITYYKNGKLQCCPGQVIYSDFDEAKLS